MSEVLTRLRGRVADRLYGRDRDDAARDARVTGVPVSRETVSVPKLRAKDFRLPGTGVQVSAERLESFASLTADAIGRISRADRSQVAEKVKEFAQELLNRHFSEAREHESRLVKGLSDTWVAEQDRQRKAFHDDPEIGRGGRAVRTLASAEAAILEYGRVHGTKHEKALRAALTETGAGNRHEVIRAFAHFGRGLPDRSRAGEVYKGGLRQGDGDDE